MFIDSLLLGSFRLSILCNEIHIIIVDSIPTPRAYLITRYTARVQMNHWIGCSYQETTSL